MASRRRIIRVILVVLVLVVGLVGLAAWNALRVEEVPEALDTMDAERKPEDLVYEGMGTPDLKLTRLRGKTAFLWLEGQASFQNKDERPLGRALSRWDMPETTIGYMIGDAAGFALFKEKAREFIEGFQEDVRFPLYVDWDGRTRDTFKLPQGHVGLVILGPDGEVLMRHSGPADEAKLEEIRGLLGASEPPPGPDAPSFSLGELTNESCEDRKCVIAFLGRSMTRADIPFLEGGLEVEKKDAMKVMRQPELRLIMSLRSVALPDTITGIVVGSLTGLEDEIEGWTFVPDDPAAREAFGIEPDRTAFFIITEDGKLAFSETGAFPMYRVSRITEILGVEPKRRDDEE